MREIDAVKEDIAFDAVAAMMHGEAAATIFMRLSLSVLRFTLYGLGEFLHLIQKEHLKENAML